jgi:hypothetical protein
MCCVGSGHLGPKPIFVFSLLHLAFCTLILFKKPRASTAPSAVSSHAMSSPSAVPLGDVTNSTHRALAETKREGGERPGCSSNAAEPTSNVHTSVSSDSYNNRDAGSVDNTAKPKVYHTGWRLHGLTAA